MSEEQRRKNIEEYSKKDDVIVFEIWGLDHASSWKNDFHTHVCNDQDGSDVSFTKKSFECLCFDLTERGKLIERKRLLDLVEKYFEQEGLELATLEEGYDGARESDVKAHLSNERRDLSRFRYKLLNALRGSNV